MSCPPLESGMSFRAARLERVRPAGGREEAGMGVRLRVG